MSRDHLTGLVMATMLEAEPFIERLGLKEIERQPFTCYQGGGTLLVISGIGKANAAMAAAYCCQKFRPEVICNLGAAGATGDSTPLGSIYHVERVVELDRPLLQVKGLCEQIPHVMEGFKLASLATQDRPVIDAKERQAISYQADLVDMEAASVIQACRKFGINCVVFKFVSDTPSHTDHTKIAEHIKQYRDSFCLFFSTSVVPALKIMSTSALPEQNDNEDDE